MNHAKKLALLIGNIAAWDCLAIEYYIDPRFSATQKYDSNIRLENKPKQDNWISTFSPGVDFGFRHENNELKTNFTWNQLIYDNQSELDIDEQLLSTDYVYRGERFQWNLVGAYNNQSSLNTEYLSTGQLAVQLKRQELTIAPSVSYALSEKTNLTSNYSYTDLSYQKKSTTVNLYDYKYQQGSVGFNHSYSEHDKFSFTFSSSLYELPGSTATLARSSFSQTSLTETAQIGWQHSFSEQLSTNLSFGIRYSQTESATAGYLPFYLRNSSGQLIVAGYYDVNGRLHRNPVLITSDSSNNNIGQVFSASVQKIYERSVLSLGVSQQLSPSAQGNQEQTQFYLNSNYAISERWSTGINGTYEMRSFPLQSQNSKSISNGDRTYYSITPNIKWKWTPEVSVQMSYTYRQQSYDNSSTVSSGEGNIAQLQLNYQPQINRQVK